VEKLVPLWFVVFVLGFLWRRREHDPRIDRLVRGFFLAVMLAGIAVGVTLL
jgi:hypothetical protein